MPEQIVKPLPKTHSATGFEVVLYMFLASLLVLVFGLAEMSRSQRVIGSPHAQAFVERTWIERGKGGASRYGSIHFNRVQDGKSIYCQVDRESLGRVPDIIARGTLVDIVPRPDSCYEPDVCPCSTVPVSGTVYFVLSGILFLTSASAGVLLYRARW